MTYHANGGTARKIIELRVIDVNVGFDVCHTRNTILTCNIVRHIAGRHHPHVY